MKSTTPSTLTQVYSIDPANTQLVIQLVSAGDSLSGNGQSNVQNLTVGTPGVVTPPFDLTLTTPANDPWAQIQVTVNYPAVASLNNQSTSTCHVYLKAEGTNWLWKVNTNVVGDNTSVVANGPGPSTGNSIVFQPATALNPSTPGSEFPPLDSRVVFLLDWNQQTGNLVFRGNEPLAPGSANQLVDFQTLHDLLQTRYEQQTGETNFPAIGQYVLREVAFLGSDEKPTLDALLESYGGTPGQGQLDNQAWYPTTPTAFAPTGMLGQLSNWNVQVSADVSGQPHPNLDLDVRFALQLVTWMNRQETLPHIYYIHCASGHERTGMESSAYLMAQYGFAVSEAFIFGTTVRYNDTGTPEGNLVQPCYDVGTTTTDNVRARCFPASAPAGQIGYNQTIIDMYNKLNNVTNGAFSTTSTSGDTGTGQSGQAYVYPCYPWENFTVNAKVGWQSTGFAVTAGTAFSVTKVLGLWTSNPHINGGNLFGPAGDAAVIATQPGYPLVGQPEGALVARISNGSGTYGAVFLIGAGGTFTPQQTGTLELCINDDLAGLYGSGLKDNIGAVMVSLAS